MPCRHLLNRVTCGEPLFQHEAAGVVILFLATFGTLIVLAAITQLRQREPFYPNKDTPIKGADKESTGPALGQKR